jgi:hypothetical protein
MYSQYNSNIIKKREKRPTASIATERKSYISKKPIVN